MTCPACHGGSFLSEVARQRFPYGAGVDSVVLTADVPVRVCCQCGYVLMGEDAEQARSAAVRRYLDRKEEA